MSTPANVPVGPTTIVGYGGTAVGLIAAILSMVFPEGDEQTIALIASAVFALGSFLVTQIGRYVQAKELAKPSPIVVNNQAPTWTASTAQGVQFRGGTMGAGTPPAADPDRPRDPAVDLVGEQDLPTDEEEAAAPLPDDDTTTPDDPDNGGR